MNRRVGKIWLTMLLCVIIAALVPATSTGQRNGKKSKVCSSCKGSKKCALCKGTGQSGQVIQFRWGTEYIPCLLCGGKKKCTSCNGTGRRDVELAILRANSHNNHGGHSNNSHNNNHNNNSGSQSSRRCSSCGGTGLRASVAYENDPSGAAFAISQGIVGYVNKDGTRCHRCGKYTYHLHYKCTDCNNR